ncbi:MAG: hypothetical protein MJ064_06530 [Lachnospiraceae bacterium]|nr:hypothetical protein [Lachnospiraceae bacterium]
MFQLWAKMWKSGRLEKDMTVSNGSEANRTKKVFEAIDDVCREWDLSKPIWLASNIKDFKRHAKTRFSQDSFSEAIAFDYLEIQVLEED